MKKPPRLIDLVEKQKVESKEKRDDESAALAQHANKKVNEIDQLMLQISSKRRINRL